MQSNRLEESFHGHHDGESPQKKAAAHRTAAHRSGSRAGALSARRGQRNGKSPQKAGAQGATNEARIAFLEGYGWQVEPEPVKTQQVTVPADPSEYSCATTNCRISQGYDLLQYSGEELTRYVYRITNYPDESGVYYATLLVKDGQVVGADVASNAKTGVMHGLKMPE